VGESLNLGYSKFSSLGNEIRLMWNNFDSDWSKIAFDRIERGFERKIK